MTQPGYTPRVGHSVVLKKTTKDGATLRIEGTLQSVMDHADYGLSIRFEGLDGYINLDKSTTLDQVSA